MKIEINTINKKYTGKIYVRVTILAFLMHIVFAILFLFSAFKNLMYYNIASSIFYIFMIYLSTIGYYKTIVSLINLEVLLFTYYFTRYLGWETGYYLYLFAMASLIYFCPFKIASIPYLFGILDAIMFIYLFIHMKNVEVIVCTTFKQCFFLYLFNGINSFIIILYSAFLSGISTNVVKEKLELENNALNQIANYDQLTGASTRYQFFEILKSLTVDTFAIAMFDFDDFKHVNDTYGHNCGDYVLNETISLIMKNERDVINVVRWGGEEFIILFTKEIEKNDMFQYLNEIRKKVEMHKFVYEEQQIKITITIGATMAKKKEDIEKVIERIDKNLYQGKNNGKNCVILK